MGCELLELAARAAAEHARGNAVPAVCGGGAGVERLLARYPAEAGERAVGDVAAQVLVGVEDELLGQVVGEAVQHLADLDVGRAQAHLRLQQRQLLRVFVDGVR